MASIWKNCGGLTFATTKKGHISPLFICINETMDNNSALGQAIRNCILKFRNSEICNFTVRLHIYSKCNLVLNDS